MVPTPGFGFSFCAAVPGGTPTVPSSAPASTGSLFWGGSSTTVAHARKRGRGHSDDSPALAAGMGEDSDNEDEDAGQDAKRVLVGAGDGVGCSGSSSSGAFGCSQVPQAFQGFLAPVQSPAAPAPVQHCLAAAPPQLYVCHFCHYQSQWRDALLHHSCVDY